MKNTCILLALLILVPARSCTTYKVIRHNFPEIDNYKIFSNRDVSKSSEPFHFNHTQTTPPKLDSLTATLNNKEVPLEEFLRSSKTVAFIVIKDNSVVYEKYFRGASESTLVNSFSMTKSLVSALVGVAISEGYIKSVDQTVADFLPEFKDKAYGKVTIRNLLQMTSGIGFSFNGYSPFADNAQFYYGSNLREQVAKLKAKQPQGKVWKYKESDPQMLGLILERATGRTLSKYLEEKIWQPLGMEFDASWSLDSKEDGVEKAFCCFNARARDFAKFGMLYLNKGAWNDKQIVPKEWIEASTQADTSNGGAENYKYLWWLPRPREGDFYADGNLGQFIYVNPKSNVVIVKLSETNKRGVIPLFRKIARSLS
jgi:CubicO group peptidase (beta-lactamase class C family)